MDKNSSYARDHMANERTFLAWIRTSIGVMAFGFVVEKFALFLKKFSFYLGKEGSLPLDQAPHEVQGYSTIFGVVLVTLGTLLCLLAFINYKKVEKQIDSGTYHSSALLNVMLTLSVLLIGVFLVVYLNSHM